MRSYPGRTAQWSIALPSDQPCQTKTGIEVKLTILHASPTSRTARVYSSPANSMHEPRETTPPTNGGRILGPDEIGIALRQDVGLGTA